MNIDLFAIAAEISIRKGYNGAMFGRAANEKLLGHYISTMGAEYIGILHKYHFGIQPAFALQIIERYDYEWLN